jgi:ubiquinone/menaquinone biosynthesis C-methylase UbiE
LPSPGALVVVALGVAALAALAYWAYVITEGAYFGSRLVTLLYDRDADRYDEIKGYLPEEEHLHLVAPLRRRLGDPRARVLDVATGTARLPLALLADVGYTGEVVGLDLSPGMLRRAWMKVGGWSPRVHLVCAAAAPLPFADGAFDAVLSLEALEFTRRPGATLREMARVLRPGGVFAVTNRVGWEALLMPGRAFRRPSFEADLRGLGLTDVETTRWQTYYDLVWARKPVPPPGGGPPVESPPTGAGGRDRAGWPAGVRCPVCGGPLAPAAATLVCAHGHRFLWHGGAWDLTAGAAGGN